MAGLVALRIIVTLLPMILGRQLISPIAYVAVRTPVSTLSPTMYVPSLKPVWPGFRLNRMLPGFS